MSAARLVLRRSPGINGITPELRSVCFGIKNDKPITPSALASVLALSRGNLSQCITALERTELVKRTLSESDSRSYLITLKPDGQRKVLKLIKKFDAIQGRYEAAVGGKELQIALNTLSSLR